MGPANAAIITDMAPIINSMSRENQDDASAAVPEKKVPKILPPNDPTRKDWGILSDSLGLDAHAKPSPGASPEQAAIEMKVLLLRCVQSDKAYEAVIMKCGGGAIAGRLKENVGARGDFAGMMSFLKSRLWNRRQDGAMTVSQKGREFSTNDIIQDWNPINGGIGKYLQINIGNILARDWKTSQMELADPKKDSLNRLLESGREPDTTGRIFNASAGGSDESDSVDYVERDSAFDKDSDRFSANLRGQRGEENPLEEGEPTAEGIEALDVEEEITPQRREFEVALLASKTISNGSPTLRTTEHPDYRVLAAALLEDVPEAELDAAGRVVQLRDMAKRAITIHYQENSDIADVLEAVETWDPANVSFARYFPEACVDISTSLDDAGKKEIKNADVQIEFAMDFIAVSKELNQQSQRLPSRPDKIDTHEWDEMVSTSHGWFSAHANSEEDLQSTSRPDYIALCALMQKKPDKSLSPGQLGEELKSLHGQWTSLAFKTAQEIGSRNSSVFSENFEAVSEMSKRMQSWNPLVDGYAGEQMVQHLNEIRLEQWERESNRREAAAAALLAQQTSIALARPRLVTKPIAIPPRPKQTSFFDELAVEEVRTTPPALTQAPGSHNEPSVS